MWITASRDHKLIGGGKPKRKQRPENSHLIETYELKREPAAVPD